MDPVIIVAIIGFVSSVLCVILSNKATYSKILSEFKVALAVMEEKITTLAAEVREHNAFAKRIPVLETKLEALESRVRTLENSNHT